MDPFLVEPTRGCPAYVSIRWGSKRCRRVVPEGQLYCREHAPRGSKREEECNAEAH